MTFTDSLGYLCSRLKSPKLCKQQCSLKLFRISVSAAVSCSSILSRGRSVGSALIEVLLLFLEEHRLVYTPLHPRAIF